MIKVKKGMKALVVGLGKSGVSATKLLIKKGIKVKATDELNKTDLLDSLAALEGYSYKAELGKHILKSFVEPDFIVVSPGVDLNIKPLKQAEKSGIPIISEIELASQFITKPVIAVTGTNGKTTTSALIAEIINAGGKSAFLCGNVGTPLSEYVVEKERSEYVVLEISSFQLDTTFSLKPSIALFLNVAPDHLDRYPTYDDYVKSKMRLKNNMDAEDHLIINQRDSMLMSMLSGHPSKPLYFTSDSWEEMPVQYADKFQGCYFDTAGKIYLKAVRWKDHEFNVKDIPLRGLHNKENIMAAILAGKLTGITNESIQKTISTFQPLPHRMEFVARKNQVNFYNDSKGTNVASLKRSLQSFPTPVILIAGGRDKGEDYSDLGPMVEKHVKNLILVGEAKEKINRAIGDYTETFLVGTFEEAIFLSYQKARSGDVILLSPGCASQDMFKNYEERGDRFKQIVNRF